MYDQYLLLCVVFEFKVKACQHLWKFNTIYHYSHIMLCFSDNAIQFNSILFVYRFSQYALFQSNVYMAVNLQP